MIEARFPGTINSAVIYPREKDRGRNPVFTVLNMHRKQSRLFFSKDANLSCKRKKTLNFLKGMMSCVPCLMKTIQHGG